MRRRQLGSRVGRAQLVLGVLGHRAEGPPRGRGAGGGQAEGLRGFGGCRGAEGLGVASRHRRWLSGSEKMFEREPAAGGHSATSKLQGESS